MTVKERIEKKANEYANDFCNCMNDVFTIERYELESYIADGYEDGYKQGVKDIAQMIFRAKKAWEINKENKKLKAQIEEQKSYIKAVDDVNVKMRNCHNCKNVKRKTINGYTCFSCPEDCFPLDKPCDKWKPME